MPYPVLRSSPAIPYGVPFRFPQRGGRQAGGGIDPLAFLYPGTPGFAIQGVAQIQGFPDLRHRMEPSVQGRWRLLL